MTTSPDMTAFEDDFEGWFTDDQDPAVTVLALIGVCCFVAAGAVVLGLVGVARAVWRWQR